MISVKTLCRKSIPYMSIFLYSLYSLMSLKFLFLLLFFNIIFIFLRFCLFLERWTEGGRDGGRETSMCGCHSHSPHWGPGPQPRHVPWLGIEPATLYFTHYSIHWATAARAWYNLLCLFLHYHLVPLYGHPQQSPNCCPCPWVLFPLCAVSPPLTFPHPTSRHPALHLWVCPHFPSYFTLFIKFHIEFYSIEIIWYFSFCDWLIALSIMFSLSIHAVANSTVVLFFMAK